MNKFMLFIPLALAISGCAELMGTAPAQAPAQPAAAVRPQGTMLGSRAVAAAALDTTTDAEKVAALSAPAAAGERALGKVVVALGPPAEQGLWLKTSLVSAPVQGRVEALGGKSLALELRPGTGGALLSLAAFRALGLPLTGLPEILVFGP